MSWWNRRWRAWEIASLLGGLALLVYANSFPGAFIFDDLSRVVENPLVAAPDLRLIFTTDYWGGDSNSGLYRPLTILSLGLNRILLGEAAWGFHLINVLLHLLGVLLVYAVARQLLPQSAALLGAALFGVHPLHTEVVDVVVGRSELLAATFVLMAVWLYLAESRHVTLLVPGCYLLALWSKEHAVMLPAFLLALDVRSLATLRTLLQRRWKVYALLLGVALFWWWQRTSWVVQRDAIAPDAPDRILTPLHFLDPLSRILTALKMQLLYLAKLCLPWQLNIHYGGEFTAPVTTADIGWLVLIAMGLVLLLLYLGKEWRTGRWTPRLVLCYLLAVAPTANLFILTGVTFAERLTFLPSAWFCCGLVCAGEEYLAKTGRGARILLYAGLVVLLLWGGRTLARNRDFHDELRLAKGDAAQQPDNPMLWLNLATTLGRNGKDDEALAALERVVVLAPRFPMGLTNYAEALYRAQRYADALNYATKALQAEPGSTYPPARLTAAKAAVKLQQFRLALEHLQATGGQFVMYGVYWETLGRALEGIGDRLGALQAYQRERAVYFPLQSDVQLRMAAVLRQLGRDAEAEILLRDEAGRHAAKDAGAGRNN